ncbi:unnamed protein product, partial [Laminaria digitata]
MSDEYAGSDNPVEDAGGSEVTSVAAAMAAAAAGTGASREEFEVGSTQKLGDLLCLQDPPSPLPSARAASPPRAMPTPMAAPSSTQALRRSPRLAGVPPPPTPEVAAAAAAAARMSAPSARKVG